MRWYSAFKNTIKSLRWRKAAVQWLCKTEKAVPGIPEQLSII